MGLKHKAKKGTVIEANGVKITVLRGSPQLEITAPSEASIVVQQGNQRKALSRKMKTKPRPRGGINPSGVPSQTMPAAVEESMSTPLRT